MAAKDVLLAASWNPQAFFAKATQTGNGSGTVGSAVAQGKYGRPGWAFEAVNTPVSSKWYSLSLGGALGAVATAHMRIYFALDALPVGGNCLIGGLGNNASGTVTNCYVARVRPGGVVETGFQTTAAWDGVLTGSQLSTVKVCPRRWHRVELAVDVSANPWLGNAFVNGVASPQSSRANAAATWRGAFAHDATSFAPPLNTTQAYSTELWVSTAMGDFPLGPGHSELFLPNRFGTNVGAAGFRTEAGGAIGAGDWARISDLAPPWQDGVALALANDGLSVEMFGPFGSANHLEFLFDVPTLAAGEYGSCVQGYTELYQSTAPTPAVQQRARILSGGTQLGDQTGAGGSSVVVNAFRWGVSSAGLGTRVPPPAGGWTQAALNGLALQWGPNTNAIMAGSTQYHGLSWFALEVAVSTDSEPTPVGCAGGLMPLLGVG